MRMAGVVVASAGVAMVVLSAACSGGSKQSPAKPTETPASSPSPAAETTATASAASPTGAPTPAGGTGRTIEVNGRSVPLFDARVADPLTNPRSLSLVVTHGCWSCDVPDMAIERDTWDASGALHQEILFSAKNRGGSYITGIGATPDGSVLVAGVCVRSYCGPMGGFFADARVTIFRSLDGGVSWDELTTVSGYAFPLGVARDGQAVVLRADSPTSSFVARLPSGDLFQTPTAAGTSDWPWVLGGEPYWWPGRGRTLVSPRMNWQLDVPAGSSVTGVVSWGRGALLWQWVTEERAGATAYVGDPHEDGLLAKAWVVPPIDLAIKGWLGLSASLIGNATFEGRRLPVLVHLGPEPSDLTIQPVSTTLFVAADRNRIVAGLLGPFVRVSGTGSCLNVRSAPSASAASLGCFADGVLLHELNESTDAEGHTWVKVLTPTPPDDWIGQQGWAVAEFLER